MGSERGALWGACACSEARSVDRLRFLPAMVFNTAKGERLVGLTIFLSLTSRDTQPLST